MGKEAAICIALEFIPAFGFCYYMSDVPIKAYMTFCVLSVMTSSKE